MLVVSASASQSRASNLRDRGARVKQRGRVADSAGRADEASRGMGQTPPKGWACGAKDLLESRNHHANRINLRCSGADPGADVRVRARARGHGPAPDHLALIARPAQPGGGCARRQRRAPGAVRPLRPERSRAPRPVRRATAHARRHDRRATRRAWRRGAHGGRRGRAGALQTGDDDDRRRRRRDRHRCLDRVQDGRARRAHRCRIAVRRLGPQRRGDARRARRRRRPSVHRRARRDPRDRLSGRGRGAGHRGRQHTRRLRKPLARSRRGPGLPGTASGSCRASTCWPRSSAKRTWPTPTR